ncbi:MAG: NADH:ubiquinone oxidoreductase [Bacteroidetes bacterium]|nr:MAG: NADH:ubiquinone oxidoreductase [Bacteroidota bacterium]
MIDTIKILAHQGKQYIPDVTAVEVPGVFRGRPVIAAGANGEAELAELCPTGAIGLDPLSIDLGKCTFCGECAFARPDLIQFTKDYKIATNERERLVVKAGEERTIALNPELVRAEIRGFFGGSLKLRQVSAAGDNSCEMELNACGNVNFDMGRFGIEFVASPRHADGVVITGPISENMAEPLQICYDAIPDPKIIILAGTDAISGGIFAGSAALDRSFLEKYKVDLYVPGNPVHPLTFINGVLALVKGK